MTRVNDIAFQVSRPCSDWMRLNNGSVLSDRPSVDPLKIREIELARDTVAPIHQFLGGGGGKKMFLGGKIFFRGAKIFYDVVTRKF